MAFRTKLGDVLFKSLGITRAPKYDANTDKLTRGESVFSVASADDYVEDEPTVAEWLREISPSKTDIITYVKSLFPFLSWIFHYNMTWFIGDLVAGLTVGAVVVPQSMAYAKLALLPPEFGLYSSFMGVSLYWFFATSKDITIGPVAVLSTVTGDVITEALKQVPEYRDEPEVIASSLSVLSGAIVIAFGLLRIGWLVDFISLTAISAFMTGAALNIAAGQLPALMGITGFSNRDPTYQVVINTLKYLDRTQIDAALGLSALIMLYAIRHACTFLAKRYPDKKKKYFFISTLRSAFVILLYIFISWLVNRNQKDDPLFTVLGTVPRGFRHAKLPTVNSRLISAYAGQLPVTVIVLLIEHIAISKSFGRINNYTINPSQELVAIGFTNILGPFLGAYPATGSFTRTAIKSKAGVRTPFAGVITALLVLLAIYALPALFFYIPSASLAAVIIHAVGDLITPPSTIYQFWRVSPLEVFIFFAGVFVTIFSNIENGVYTTIAVSAALLLYRVFKARGRFLGRVKGHSVIGDHVIGGMGKEGKPNDGAASRKDLVERGFDPDMATRNIFLPIDHADGSNPSIGLDAPYPGIFIYRFSEGYNYPNANHYLDYMISVIFSKTRRTNVHAYGKIGDRPWNDPGPRRGRQIDVDDTRPTLKAIILDFSSVNNVDITSVQHLIDVRNQLDHYAAPDVVDWHFACVHNRWTKRALAAAGFGYPAQPAESGESRRWKPIFSVAEIGGEDSAAAAADASSIRKPRSIGVARDIEEGNDNTKMAAVSAATDPASNDGSTSDDKGDENGDITTSSTPKPVRMTTARTKSRTTLSGGAVAVAARMSTKVAVVHGVNRPLFHIDLTSALQSAIANVKYRERKSEDES